MLLWGGLAAGALVIGIIAMVALGKKDEPPAKPEAPGFAQMDSYRGPAPTPKASEQPKRKSSEELAAERRQGEESRIESLVAKLEKNVDPATIRKEPDWTKLTTLIADAEKLVGMNPNDRRAAVSGSIEDKKSAKAKADEALELLSSNQTFSRLISEYDEALGEAASFGFFQEVRNRINTLRMRLKGI